MLWGAADCLGDRRRQCGDHGFALVDGNGDGGELEAEHWFWHEGSWQPDGLRSQSALQVTRGGSGR